MTSPVEVGRRWRVRWPGSVLPDPRLPDVADLVEADAFSGAPPSEARRLEAKGRMDKIEAAHPAPS